MLLNKMKLTFIGYPKCTTCKKAYKYLLDLGFDVTYRNIKEEQPTKEEILHWLDLGVSMDTMFNTSGALYREYNVKEKRKTATPEELVDLLASDGMLVKRPIVLYKNQVLVGFKPEAYDLLK